MSPRRWHRLRCSAHQRVALAIAVALVLVALTGVALSTRAWAEQQRTAGVLLPGTTVAGVDVGGATLDTATTQVAAELAARAEAPRGLRHGSRRWGFTAAELGATTDAAAAVAEAHEAGWSRSWVTLTRQRWLGRSSPVHLEPTWTIPQPAAHEWVADVAARVDRDPRAATLRWHDDDVEIQAERAGRRVDGDAAVAALPRMLAQDRAWATLPVRTRTPATTAADLQPHVPLIAEAARAALARPLTIRAADGEIAATPDELGAVPDLDALLASARAAHPEGAPGTPSASPPRARWRAEPAASAPGSGASAPDLLAPLVLADEALVAAVDELGEALDRPARDAALDASSGWVELTAARPGRRLDREAAAAPLADALAAGSHTADLPAEVVAPAVTDDAFAHVLLVRQQDRRLFLYEDGVLVADWPVAIGQPGHPTPTGEYVVGHRRHEPTWHNPAPDGWGEDMALVKPPGPGNPLGLRALDWHRLDGAPTLIRFHGTADIGSLGHAASRGCVRLGNDDVVALFDRVPQGARIVSLP